MKLVGGPDAAFAQCHVLHSADITEPISSTQELSTIDVHHCHTFPMVYPTFLPVDDLPSKIQQEPQMPALEEPFSSHTSSFQAPHFGKKAQSEEAKRWRKVK